MKAAPQHVLLHPITPWQREAALWGTPGCGVPGVALGSLPELGFARSQPVSPRFGGASWQRWHRLSCVGSRDLGKGELNTRPGGLSPGSCQHGQNGGAAPKAALGSCCPQGWSHTAPQSHPEGGRSHWAGPNPAVLWAVTWTPMTRAGIDLGEPPGNSQRERNQQVELPAAP